MTQIVLFFSPQGNTLCNNALLFDSKQEDDMQLHQNREWVPLVHARKKKKTYRFKFKKLLLKINEVGAESIAKSSELCFESLWRKGISIYIETTRSQKLEQRFSWKPRFVSIYAVYLTVNRHRSRLFSFSPVLSLSPPRNLNHQQTSLWTTIVNVCRPRFVIRKRVAQESDVRAVSYITLQCTGLSLYLCEEN